MSRELGLKDYVNRTGMYLTTLRNEERWEESM